MLQVPLPLVKQYPHGVITPCAYIIEADGILRHPVVTVETRGAESEEASVFKSLRLATDC